VPPAAEPLEKARFFFGEVGPGDRDRIESDLAAPLLHARCDARFPDCGLHSSMVALKTHLPDEGATLALGAALAQSLEPGLTIYLVGELGAGKTTLVRGVLRALGHQGPVKSPTYTLVELYEVSRLHLHHFDFYRFHDPREWIDAGFRETFNGRNVSLIEWPEKAGGMLPPADVQIVLESSNSGRNASLRSYSLRGQKCLALLESRFAFPSAAS
jgi:tRNA threonylcarbamoyladenosine biosynthesis protein TsaE